MEKLWEAVRDGDMNKLYESIRLDPYVLERIDAVPYEDTPLHAAARGGHTNLAIEMMRLKPSLGRKLNPDGLSPLDVALGNGHTDTASRLVKFDSQLIRVQGKEGFTPLHRVVEIDETELLAEYLVACPQSIEDLTVRRETALHIAAAKGHVKALQVLLGWVGRAFYKGVLKWKDEKGNTALHVAAHQYTTAQHPTTIDPRFQILKLLSKRVSKRAKNLEGRTAHDIVSGQFPNAAGKEAKKITRPGLAMPPPDDIKLAEFFISAENIFEKYFRYKTRLRMTLSNETINVVLVIATLIITSTYQAALTPPNILSELGERTNTTTLEVITTTADNFTTAANFTTTDANFTTVIEYTTTAANFTANFTTTVIKYTTPIASSNAAHSKNLLPWFLCSNAIAISVAVAIIILIIKDNIYTIMLYISLAALVLSHMIMITLQEADAKVEFASIPFAVFLLIFCFKYHITLMELMTYSEQHRFHIQRKLLVSLCPSQGDHHK